MGNRACLFCPTDVESWPMLDQYQFWRGKFSKSLASTFACAALSIVFITAATDKRDMIVSQKPEITDQANMLVNFGIASWAAVTALSGTITVRRRRKMNEAWQIINLP